MSTPTEPTAPAAFADFDLAAPMLETLSELGYEQPTPIQASALAPLLAGRDLLGQAQTGTGKTAAFALPALSRLDASDKRPQVLVLTPTRELCIQVAEAFHRYAASLPGFRVLPVYGGTEFRGQLRSLKHGVHVVVGTPGRLMDHMRRGTLDLSALRMVILDEADEMLRMGFIDDVEWILEQTPSERQTALFSATLPAPVRRIAARFLKEPEEVTIRAAQRTADTIAQRYWLVDGLHKLDALTRILETESYDGMLVFVRTRVETEELSRRLEARGHACAALSGDVPQAQREKIVERFKQGAFDVLIATDVAARGLDVDRISHVVNYDIPHDTEAYVHRIGRTGRAGRSGQAILFVSRRERGMLRAIERATNQQITRMDVPSTDEVNAHRIRRFVERIGETLASANDLDLFQDVVERFQHDEGVPMERIAAALASIAQGQRPLLIDKHDPVTSYGKQPAPRHGEPLSEFRPQPESRGRQQGFDERPKREFQPRPEPGEGFRQQRDGSGEVRPPRPPRDRADRGERGDRGDRDSRPQARGPAQDGPPAGMDTFRLEVGHAQGIAARNIVGALTNELGMNNRAIGRITINDDHSLVELPPGMPPEVLKQLREIWMGGQRLRVTRLEEAPADHGYTRPEKRDRRPGADRRPGGDRRPGTDRGPGADRRSPQARSFRGKPGGTAKPKRKRSD